ncbi:MAG TPA: GGDEF domain-containing phosphodiesterase, partial [Thermoanaerobaculia bacterium]|nr:GGDEF domain-containing phosphodiesterase [Thermoanaerobaculia bacterium]
VDNRELFVTGSIGISLFRDAGDDVQTLMQGADTAMTRAKREGRDGFMLYRPDMNARARERMKLESSLRRALERTEFLLNYQPQIDLASGRVVGAEALLRWRRGDRVVVPPSDFISILEETGLIVSIGEWVLRTACAQVREWQGAGFPDLRLAVNLSARQFQHVSLVDAVRKVLRETGLAPRSLLLEITESVAMERAAGSLTKLAELKGLGVQLALDDFGTGYSSLSYLKRFPIDVLKIDQVFVRGVEFDAKDAALGATSIAMAHGLGLRVVAEGVETEGQREFLKRHGCDEIQGFLVSRPLTAESFRKLLG